MGYEANKISEIVNSAVDHSWSVPEFQRGFVWKSTQVRDLVESLWYDYPIGSLLIWSSNKQVVPRLASDAKAPNKWLVDGQQRTTALCILFGRKPYWWSDNATWESTVSRYDIRFDIEATEPPFFLVANAATKRSSEAKYIPLRKLLNLDTKSETDQRTLEELASRVKEEGLCRHQSVMEVFSKINRVRSIREREVVTITVDHDLEDVVEIFSRLNSKGTRVTEADIYLGIVAARNPGWVHSTFLPSLKKLEEVGFDVDPNLLFRCVTAIGQRKVRFRDIEDEFWTLIGTKNGHGQASVWNRTMDAWEQIVAGFREFGILTSSVLPTQNALVTLSALVDKYPDGEFGHAFYWFLLASRYGRYSGSSTTALEEDLREIELSGTHTDAVQRLVHRIGVVNKLTPEDFKRDYSDTRFGRLILYLMVFDRGAQDWDKTGYRIGFDDHEMLQSYRPQWHHIFPKKYLEGIYESSMIDALANFAAIGPAINITINAKAPMDYVARYAISPDKLRQQFISADLAYTDRSDYIDWLEQRAITLANAANQYLGKLSEGLPHG